MADSRCGSCSALPWKPELQRCRLKLGVGRKRREREKKRDREGGGISAGTGRKVVPIVRTTNAGSLFYDRFMTSLTSKTSNIINKWI